VVLTDQKDIHAQLVGENSLIHQLPDRTGVADWCAPVVNMDVAEGVQSKDHFAHGAPLIDMSIT
jgi:hypothetical protein